MHYVDVGTSGGVWGLERGYCMMIGGDQGRGRPPRPDLRGAGAGPGRHPAHAGPRRPRPARRAGLHPCRAGRRRALRQDGPQRHRVRPDAGLCRGLRHPARTRTSTELPEDERFDLNLADIAEVWRRGSVVSSWLLDLTAIALAEDPKLDELHRRRSPIPAKAAGPSRRRSRRRCRPTCCRRAVCPLPLAPGAHLRREAAVGDALRLRRPCRDSRRAAEPWPR